MRRVQHRFLIALLVALALAVGGIARGVQAVDIGAKTTAAVVADQPMPNGCNGCKSNDAAMPAAFCYVLCSGIAVVLPVVPAMAVAASNVPSAAAASSFAGQHGPPDPYPPRPAILS